MNLRGVLGMFETPDGLLEAAKQAKVQGYTRIEAYSPYPMEEVSDLLLRLGKKSGFRVSVPQLAFTGGISGALIAFSMQFYAYYWDYPMNIAGRPSFAWAPYIPVTFELTVLFAALSGTIGMMILNGYPRPHHPLFSIPDFDRASQDRFFLYIRSDDSRFDLKEIHAFFRDMEALSINEVNDDDD